MKTHASVPTPWSDCTCHGLSGTDGDPFAGASPRSRRITDVIAGTVMDWDPVAARFVQRAVEGVDAQVVSLDQLRAEATPYDESLVRPLPTNHWQRGWSSEGEC